MIPGRRLRDVAKELAVINTANDTLAEYHQGRKSTLTVLLGAQRGHGIEPGGASGG